MNIGNIISKHFSQRKDDDDGGKICIGLINNRRRYFLENISFGLHFQLIGILAHTSFK